MRFSEFSFVGGEISAKAQGHADEVVRTFRDACNLVFSELGPWRITDVVGAILDDDRLDSDMEWILRAKVKLRR